MPTPFSRPNEGESYEWPLAPGIAKRFWAKVDRRGARECWVWLATRNRAGYGLIRNGVRITTGSRMAWVLEHGTPIPPGLHILHTCDNPCCVNPAHLYAGTNADNVADKVKRGRSHFPQPRKRGELHPLAKLTAADVAAIRSASSGRRGEGKELAAKYGVSRATISNILRGKVWK